MVADDQGRAFFGNPFHAADAQSVQQADDQPADKAHQAFRHQAEDMRGDQRVENGGYQ